VAISQEIEAELQTNSVTPAKIHILGNAVDPDEYCPVSAEEKRALRSQLGLPPNVPIVIFVGRLAEEKGLPVLLDAWRQIETDAYLAIVGSGDLAAELAHTVAQHGLAERVGLLGRRDDVRALLQASDVWTLPSYTEGLPVSLLEALACSLPVVATPVGAIPELVTHSENGWLFPAGDVTALADALRTALSLTPEQRRAIGDQGRRVVLDRFSVDAVGGTYLKLYESVAQVAL